VQWCVSDDVFSTKDKRIVTEFSFEYNLYGQDDLVSCKLFKLQ
jgi:hypothetical protein